jgi:rare lipoprotein A
VKSFCATIFASLLAFGGCVRQPPPKPVAAVPHPHYLLAQPYEASGYWFYPAEDFTLDITGLASVSAYSSGLTANGEARDPTALTAAMQTVQLPAIATVTNLQNGRQIDVRVNDLGPADPARVITLSRRTADILMVPPGAAARVRVQLNTALSHQVIDQMGGGPRLAIATAPHAAVTAQPLAAPGAAAGAATQVDVGGGRDLQVAAVVPDRMPENVRQVGANPGQLWLRAGNFQRYDYANRLAARLGGLGGTVLRSREGRLSVFAVRAGPFANVAAADAAERRALGAGVLDARITVE